MVSDTARSSLPQATSVPFAIASSRRRFEKVRHPVVVGRDVVEALTHAAILRKRSATNRG
jgi:hypothetical protein